MRVLQSSMAFLVNLITIISMCKFPFLRTSSNIFVASLALTDLLHGLVSVFGLSMREIWTTNNWLWFKNSCYFSITCSAILIVVQLMTFTLISIERYISLKACASGGKPLTLKKAWIMVGLSWSFSIVYFCILLLFARKEVEKKPCAVDSYFKPIMSYSGAILFICCTLITIIFYVKIACLVRQSGRQVSQHNAIQNTAQVTRRKKEKRITLTMAMVVGLFFVLYSPLVFTLVTLNANSTMEHRVIYYVTLIVCDVNFWINPVIYAWQNKAFRKAFRLLLGQFLRACRCTCNRNNNMIEVIN